MIDYLEARKLIKKGFQIQAIERHTGSDNFSSYYYIKNNKFYYEWNRVTPWGNDGKSKYVKDDVDKSVLEYLKDDGREYYSCGIKR